MKAVISLQFGSFSRAMLVVSHEADTNLAELSQKLRRIVGVRNAAVISSHLQEVKFVDSGEDAVEVVKRWTTEELMK